MKFFKSFLVIVLVVLLLAAAGCGGKDETDDPSGNEAVDENGAEEVEEPDNENGNNSGDDSGINEDYFAALGGWRHFDFKPGQFMKYSLTTERGLEGWVSVQVDSGEGANLDLTIEGNWVLGGDISETATLAPAMEPFEFTYSLESEGSNLFSSLAIFDNIPFHQVKWEEGYLWEEESKILEVGGEETYAGITGRVVTYEAPHAFTGEAQYFKYVIKLDFPLPLYVETPAANDTWYYELTEVSGF